MAVLSLARGADASLPPIRLAVASVHLPAFPFFQERRRRDELWRVTEALEARTFDASVIMGDL